MPTQNSYAKQTSFPDSPYNPFGLNHIGLIDEKFVAPERVLPNASSALNIYESMRDSHQERVSRYVKIKGMIDGNTPYNKEKMRQAGRAADSNLNFKDGKVIIESVELVYWSLFNNVETLLAFETDIGDPQTNTLSASIASQELDKIIRGWKKFQTIMSEHQKDLVDYGVSFLVWPDEKDWHFDVVDVYRFLVPERTRNSTDYISIAAVEHVISAKELWDVVSSSSTDWNKEVVGAILIHEAQLGQEKQQYSSQYLAEIQTAIRNGDLCLDDLYQDDIMLVSMLIKEYDGKVSRAIFHPDLLTANDFAFYADRQFDDVSHAMQLFSFTPGERFIHGNKGAGHDIYNIISGVTQIDNTIIDSVRRSATVLVSTKAGRNKDAKQINFSYGGIVDIGEAEYQQNLMGSNLQSSVAIANYFTQKLERNNNISGINPFSPEGARRTLGEVQAQATREATVHKNRIAHYYEQLDYLFREVTRKMLIAITHPTYPGHKEALIWKNKCVKRGVPEEFFNIDNSSLGLHGLPEHMDVKATRVSGSGSQVADLIEMQSMMGIITALGERGRANTIRDYIAAVRGYRYIDRYFPEEDRTEQPTGEDTLASIENNQLEKGELVEVSPDNNHAIHGPSHLKRLQQLAQNFNESMTLARNQGSEEPMIDAEQFGQYSLLELDTAFQTIGPHFVRHLILLQRDSTRQDLARSLEQQWSILANFGDMIANNAQNHREAQVRTQRDEQQAINNEIPSEERVKMAKVESEERVKMAKLNLEMSRNANADRFKFMLESMKARDDIAVKRSKALNEMEIASQKAYSEIAAKVNQNGNSQGETSSS